MATHHLNQIKDFKSEMISPVIDKLTKMKFDAVCIENMPTELLMEIQSRNDSAFAELLAYFGGFRLEIAASAQKSLDISFLEAKNQLQELISKNPSSDDDRIKIIELMLACGDITSATLQYSYLKDKNTSNKTELIKYYKDEFQKNMESKNEIFSLALPIASNLQLHQLHNIDNLQDESLLLKHFPNFIEDYTNNQDKFQHLGSLPVFTKTGVLIENGVKANNLFPLYEFLNSSDFMSSDFEAQWKIWLTTQFPSGSDRARYSLWEMRNLQITANILQTAAYYPGKRILVIIGASHKSFIEKYLEEIPDIELIRFNE